MSQQEMDFEEVQRDGPQASYSGYQGTSQHYRYEPGVYGQKLSGWNIASAGQRLTLAIVSLVLFMVMIFGLVLIAVAAHADMWAAIPIVIIILAFGAVAAIINLVFNRGH